jgi:hypothetical protein
MAIWNIRGDETDKYLNTDDVVVEFSEKSNNKPQALDWLNWVSLDMDEKNDAIHMHLSTSDSRGSQFSISLTRPKKIVGETKCLIFDVRADHNYSPISMTRLSGGLIDSSK